jgi:hypothetical protein
VLFQGEAHPAEQTKINMPPAHLIDGQPLMMGPNPITINKPIQVGQNNTVKIVLIKTKRVKKKVLIPFIIKIFK